jgi:zinc and cadmium transporter
MTRMSSAFAYAIASVVVVSLISFVGIAFISMSDERLRRINFFLVSLAVGSLFGDAFIHLLPEAFEKSPDKTEVAAYVLAGIFAFFVLEKFLLWRHQHTVDTENTLHPVGYMNLIADGVHNLIDGIIIGASYLVSIPVGLATTVAVVLHEIPQEIGDFGVLIYAGFSRTKALSFNFLSATLSIVGAIAALLVGSKVTSFSSVMVPFAAGGFVYIAGSDLIPELHKESSPLRSVVQLAAMGAGVGLMLLLILLE